MTMSFDLVERLQWEFTSLFLISCGLFLYLFVLAMRVRKQLHQSILSALRGNAIVIFALTICIGVSIHLFTYWTALQTIEKQDGLERVSGEITNVTPLYSREFSFELEGKVFIYSSQPWILGKFSDPCRPECLIAEGREVTIDYFENVIVRAESP